MIKLAPAALKADLQVRQERVRIAMEEEGYDALLVTSNVNLLYLFGSIYEGQPICRQRVNLSFSFVVHK